MRTLALTPADLKLHEAVTIPADLLNQAGVRRVTDTLARALLGVRMPGDLSGIVYPRVDPTDPTRAPFGYRVRRDHPEIEDGKPKNKYISSIDRPHLFFPPFEYDEVEDVSVPVMLVEAEKSALAGLAAGIRCGRKVCPVALGGCWGWRGRIGKTTDAAGARVDEVGPLPDFALIPWQGRDTIIIFDANVTTNPKVQAARRALALELETRGARVRVVDLPVEDGVNGPDDYLGKHGGAALFALIDAAKPADSKPTKREKPEKPKQGREVQLEDPEPWADPVEGAAVLSALVDMFERYLALPKHASIALALWTLHCYTFSAWFASPFLAITSPVKRCGKTLLLIVLGALVPRRLFASNVTPAVLFRTIEKYGPTLLIDEADTFIRENDELRGVLNSGHTRTTAVAIRAVGDDHDPRAFSTWCPKAIALIGKLPDTLADRAIEVAMRRRTAGESVDRLRQDRIEGECLTLRRQAARWAADHIADLQDADPDVPGALHDRAADCWRPLLALADRAGGDWPMRAREAARELSGAADDADQPAAVLLLTDIQKVFGVREEVSSADLVKTLRALDSRPWGTWGRDDKGLSTHALARLLKDFKVHPIKIRFGEDTLNGYTKRMFEDAWARYTPAEVEHRNNVNNDGPQPAFSEVERPKACSTLENGTFANNDGRCSSVPVQTAGEGEDADLFTALPFADYDDDVEGLDL